MEIGKDCEPYLQSDEVIKIFQTANTILHNRVFACLQKLKTWFCRFVPLKNPSVPEDILLQCAEEAFSSAQAIFYNHLKSNHFKPATHYCTGYVKGIFKKTYLELYYREVKRKNLPPDYSNDKELFQSENEGEKRLFKKDFISLKIEAILKTLSEEDNKIYKMAYTEQLKRQEMATLLGIQPAAVTNKVSRFLKRFAEAWKNQNKK